MEPQNGVKAIVRSSFRPAWRRVGEIFLAFPSVVGLWSLRDRDGAAGGWGNSGGARRVNESGEVSRDFEAIGGGGGGREGRGEEK